MAYVPGFEWDVFISYAHVDNLPRQNKIEPWVTVFKSSLERLLQRKLGAGYEDLQIFFDESDQKTSYHFDNMIKAAKSSAIFLPILSRAYVTRSFIEEEIKGFLSDGPKEGRVFPVLIDRQKNIDPYPPFVKRLTPGQFFDENGITLSPSLQPIPYELQIQKLSETIREQLAKMRGAAPAVKGQQDGPVILLAQGNLEDERESVRSYLLRFGCKVLPDGDDPRVVYPQGGKDFQDAFREDLRKAKVFVQLLGRRPTMRPADLPVGYDRFQYEAAVAEAKTRPASSPLAVLCWRHPEHQAVDDSEHRKLLSSEHVIFGELLESFKAMIRRAAEEKPAPPPPPPGTEPLVFINADQSDRDAADAYLKECREIGGCEVYVRSHSGLPEEIAKFVKECMRDCDILVHLYGNSPQSWVQSQVRFFQHVKRERKLPPRVHTLFIGPPEPTRDPGVAAPGLKLVVCKDGFGLEPLRALLAELSA